MDETGLPDHIVDAVDAFARTLAPFIPVRDLRLGGGTVLQARWQHRRSTDADLFCDPETYAEAVRTRAREMERALSEVSNTLAGEDTFVDQIATYTRIGGVGTTILPAVVLVDGGSRRFVPGTRVETLTSAEILAGKLVHRLHGAGIADARDLYDLALAHKQDRAALGQAVSALADHQRVEVAAMVEMLPQDWPQATRESPLLDPKCKAPDLSPLLALLRTDGRTS